MRDNNPIWYIVLFFGACFFVGFLNNRCSNMLDPTPTLFDIGDGKYHTATCIWVNEDNIEDSFDTPAEARAAGLEKHSCCPDDESEYYK